MKGKRGLERPQSYKVLEGEAEKLKDKLEGLRQQIKAKKQEKELSKTMHAMSYQPSKVNGATTAATDKEDQLFKLMLADIKVDPIEPKLRERGIVNLEKLIACSEQEIDQWKDIAVGYRIKLKKYIQKSRQKSTSVFSLVTNEAHPGEQNQKQEMDIEQIIKHRKAEQVFVALTRKNEEGQESEPQLAQADQEKMMLSILEVISVKQRSSSLSKVHNENKHVRTVHWSPSVEEMEKSHKVKIYPKETISKSLFHVKENEKDGNNIKNEVKIESNLDKGVPNYKYCWSCLKRIDSSSPITSERSFCSPSCQINYQQTVNPVRLLQQIQETQEKYNKYVISGREGDQEEQIDLIFQ